MVEAPVVLSAAKDLHFPSIDPEITSAIDARCAEVEQGAAMSSTTAKLLALGSIPIALGALAKDVYGQAPSDIIDALRLGLQLEYLESELYSRGIAAAGLIPTADRTIFTTINAQESAHVTALLSLMQGRGTPNAKPAFDFTGNGIFTGFAFLPTQYETFKMLAHAFEDFGVRAYKGQLPRLVTEKSVLTPVLTIHSVEARHAAEIRRLRGKKGWISSQSRDDLPSAFQSIYDGEENTTHAGIDVTALAGVVGGGALATEAFDEPLTKDKVSAVIRAFLA